MSDVINEPCFVCNENVRIDRAHWRVHMTTSNEIVPRDYDGDDSQGTFAISDKHRKDFPLAWHEDPEADAAFIASLDPHIQKVMKVYGLTTMAECKALGAQGLRQLRGAGARTVNEIAHAMRDHGEELPHLRGEGVELPKAWDGYRG